MKLTAALQRKLWIALTLIVVLGFSGYFLYAVKHPSTDDAYVEANVIHLAAQVTAPVEKVYVYNHDIVKKGQLLVELDPASFQIAVQKAQAELTYTQQQIDASEDQHSEAQSLLDQRNAELAMAKSNALRYQTLYEKGYISKIQNEQAEKELKVAKATHNSATEQLAQMLQETGNKGRNNTRIQMAKAVLAQAQLDLQHTRIYAPCTGEIAEFDVRPGDVATAMQPLFALVDNHEYWVDANFKEDVVGKLHAGQKASVRLDMYPGAVFQGKVVGISAGSGDTFSIMPPENASGNWVKITQRFPVKVIISPEGHPLRVGSSAVVTINL